MYEPVSAHLTQNPCYQANVNKSDSRYVLFQQRGPLGGMLHSVGCAQPSAAAFLKTWNKSTYTNSCVHGVIDANTGVGYEALPPNYRGWHGGGACNNTHLGIEMCESGYIKYTGSGAKFEVLDLQKAREDCTRAYNTAVQWFARLAKDWNWDVDTAIISHKEGGQQGVASQHIDPEHYWSGLGMPYTMNGFRADVKKAMAKNMTADELEEFVTEILDKQFWDRWKESYDRKMQELTDNDAGKWSKDARDWAVENGIVSGVGTFDDGTTNYAWQRPLTREQYVQMEYKQATGNGQQASGDDDTSSVSPKG